MCDIQTLPRRDRYSRTLAITANAAEIATMPMDWPCKSPSAPLAQAGSIPAIMNAASINSEVPFDTVVPQRFPSLPASAPGR
jgi:hypothetical protein